MGKKGGGNEAKQARADEQARQERVRQGTKRINSIFDGQTVGSGKLAAGAAFDPKAKYYNADGSVWAPTTKPTMNTIMEDIVREGGGQRGTYTEHVTKQVPGAVADPRQQFLDALKGGKLYSGTQKKPGFDNAYFAKQKQNYIDYATPQLEDQYGNANKELTFALARGGLLDSSARAQKEGDLSKEYTLNKQQIADQALSYEGQARNSVEDARNNLVATLNATGDAEGAASSALARSAALSKPTAYSPLTNLFGDFTAALGTQAALERANYYSGGQTPVRYKTGLFTPNSGSVKVQ